MKVEILELYTVNELLGKLNLIGLPIKQTIEFVNFKKKLKEKIATEIEAIKNLQAGVEVERKKVESLFEKQNKTDKEDAALKEYSDFVSEQSEKINEIYAKKVDLKIKKIVTNEQLLKMKINGQPITDLLNMDQLALMIPIICK